MLIAGAQAYNAGLAPSPQRVQGHSPWWGVKAPETESRFKTVISRPKYVLKFFNVN